MDEVREDADAVHPQILSEQFDIVVDVPIHAHPHVPEQTLVDPQNRLVHLLRQDGVHALVQTLREQDLVCDERRGEVGKQHLHVYQPVVDVGPFGIQCEILEGLCKGFVETVCGTSQLFASLDIHDQI